MRNLSLLLLLPISLFSTAIFAMDCSKATTVTEKNICSSSQLQQLDAVLNKDYQAYIKHQDKAVAKQQQLAWLKERDLCQDDVCLSNSIINRIKALSGSGNVSVIKGASEQWDFILSVAGCNDNKSYSTCEGAGTLDIFKKDRGELFQRIAMENIFIELDTKGKATTNLIEMYGDNNSGLVIEDINFDNHDDIALRNGNSGAYGGPSYDIYLFDVTKQQFRINASLTELASTNLGLFGVDKKTKTITTFTKSGCCWHQSSTYQLANDKPVLIEEVTEGYTADGESVVLTTREWVNGKWKVTEKTEKAE